MIEIIVSNTGPFIHLAQINLLKVFSIFPKICIPKIIVSEFLHGEESGIKEIPS